MTWTDSSFRQGRDDPRPVRYRFDDSMWPLVGVTILAASALAVLYGLVWLWRHFPGLWA